MQEHAGHICERYKPTFAACHTHSPSCSIYNPPLPPPHREENNFLISTMILSVALTLFSPLFGPADTAIQATDPTQLVVRVDRPVLVKSEYNLSDALGFQYPDIPVRAFSLFPL